MRHTRNLGLQALIQQKEVQADRLSAYHLGFVLGPCINASGRLDTAVRSLKLLLADQKESAIILATELADLNEERKQMTADGLDAAVEMIQAQALDQQKVMVVYLKDLHESLAGIVAGRIRELYHHPVFVLTKAEDGVKGSGRSIETYSMYEELCKCQDLFTKFGGHKMAAGLSIPEEKVQEFTERINANATLTEDDFIPKILIDVPMPLAYVNRQLVEELKVLEPFGKGNARPVFAERQVQVESARILGKNKNVLKLQVKDLHGTRMDAMYFGDVNTFVEYVREKFGDIACECLLHGHGHGIVMAFTYYPDINEYQGVRTPQIVIQNYK